MAPLLSHALKYLSRECENRQKAHVQTNSHVYTHTHHCNRFAFRIDLVNPLVNGVSSNSAVSLLSLSLLARNPAISLTVVARHSRSTRSIIRFACPSSLHLRSLAFPSAALARFHDLQVKVHNRRRAPEKKGEKYVYNTRVQLVYVVCR